MRGTNLHSIMIYKQILHNFPYLYNASLTLKNPSGQNNHTEWRMYYVWKVCIIFIFTDLNRQIVIYIYILNYIWSSKNQIAENKVTQSVGISDNLSKFGIKISGGISWSKTDFFNTVLVFSQKVWKLNF